MESRLGRVQMKHNLAITNERQLITSFLVPICKRLVMIGAVTLAITVPAISQNSEVQQKLADVKQAAAENKQKLRQYQWIETTQLTLKGDAKPPTKNSCQYGPDGKVQETLIGPPPQQPSGGGPIKVSWTFPSGPYWQLFFVGGFASPFRVSCVVSIH